MLLSSVAERVYWFARYVERVENTARMILVNNNLLMDMPHNSTLGWAPIVSITGIPEKFYEKHKEATERNVMSFLVMDSNNPSCMMCSIGHARENLRTSRAIFPRAIWETLNDLYNYAKENKSAVLTRRDRYEFLNHIIDSCHLISGKLSASMSHDQIYEFVRMGRNLERADMTTRVIDVRAENLLPKHDEDLKPFDDIQWKSVLDSLAGYQMYRRYVHVRVRGVEVLRYLLQDIHFPRAINHCLNQVELCLRNLPMNEAPQYALVKAQRMVRNAKVEKIVHDNLNDFINQLQLAFIDINAELTSTYFEGKEVSPALYYGEPGIKETA
ncbi:MAG: alpha-E domain-containing protein [Gammaproteobacteria bacterium]